MSRNWRNALITLAAVLVVHVALFHETFAVIVETWYSSETYAHGFLIFPIGLYMAWTRHRELARLSPQPDYLALGPIALLVFLWTAAALVDVLVVQEFSVVMLVSLLVWAIMGRRIGYALIYPLGYLFFAVPVGEFAVEPMMDYTAVFTIWALKATGIPVFAEGRFITIPSGQWEVAEACSGVRYLIASMALGFLYAYLNYRTVYKRLIFIAMSFAVPVLANWFRAYGIVMIGHLSDMKLATGVDHIIYGWFFFGLVMLILFWVGSWWQEAEPEVPPAEVGRDSLSNTVGWRRLGIQAVLVLMVLGAGHATLAWVHERPEHGFALAAPEPVANGWRGSGEVRREWGGVFPGASSLASWTLTRGDDSVTLYKVRYDTEKQGRELIAWGNRLLDRRDWKYIEGRTLNVDGESGLKVGETIYHQPGGRYRLVWEWYVIAGHQTTSRHLGKALAVWGKLSGIDRGGTLVALSTDYSKGEEAGARQLLERFVRDNAGLLRPENLFVHPGE